MLPTVQLLVLLLGVIAAVAVAATRLKVPPAILMVVTGVALAVIPGLPAVTLAPEFVLLMVLPPIIYDAAVSMSWREFRFNLRPISLLAVGCVVFTTAAVAAAAHLLLGLSWPVGLILGAIVSPPDAVAPLSVMRRMRLPRRIVVILEGEGLANDATALILYRFAIVAVMVGTFSPVRAVGTFFAILVGEVLWGVGVGWAMLRLRRWVHDPRIEITLSILTPYIAYWPPQHFGGSGVLATVTAGLYISWNGLRLISAATRLQGIFFWDLFTYVIEGMVFLITGLQARTIAAGIKGHSIAELATSSAIVCGVVIAARFVWMYPATYLPRWLFPPVRRRDPSPPWQWPFALAFTGVRGIVSLAAALAIPFATAYGDPFPDRDLIIILTFAVILVTLVGQGLMLPAVVRWLGLANAGRREHHADRVEEAHAWLQAIELALTRLEELAVERALPDEVVHPLRVYYRDRLRQIQHRSDGDERHHKLIDLSDTVGLQIIEAERGLINDLYRDGKLKDEARRRIERALDLRESDLINQQSDE
jgi:CPA1 family monovalent cation:H+ antiporter